MTPGPEHLRFFSHLVPLFVSLVLSFPLSPIDLSPFPPEFSWYRIAPAISFSFFVCLTFAHKSDHVSFSFSFFLLVPPRSSLFFDLIFPRVRFGFTLLDLPSISPRKFARLESDLGRTLSTYFCFLFPLCISCWLLLRLWVFFLYSPPTLPIFQFLFHIRPERTLDRFRGLFFRVFSFSICFPSLRPPFLLDAFPASLTYYLYLLPFSLSYFFPRRAMWCEHFSLTHWRRRPLPLSILTLKASHWVSKVPFSCSMVFGSSCVWQSLPLPSMLCPSPLRRRTSPGPWCVASLGNLSF